ncbi:MAG: NADH-quinone oxidoreductase subunit D, partial [bacterium]
MEEYVSEENGLKVKHMFLNMGPSHPAMHGVIKIILQLDGERVIDSDVGIGFLHRAFEKHSENIYYNGVFPYTDRLNYVSPLINNVGYALTVEKLLGIDVTERCKYIRVIMSEISRIADHLTCIGAFAMELGAMTAFLYFMKAREAMYNLIEEVTGARITISYVRVGGVKGDLPPGFEKRVRQELKKVREEIKEVHKLLTRNRIFVDRVQHVGAISKEDAISYSFTGPLLRACGVEYDVRKKSPYLVYDQLDFDIPYGENGDNYDRYLVRMEEMEQSAYIIEQALEKMPGGNIMVDFEGKEIPAEKMADLGKFGQTKDLLHQVAVTDPTLLGSNQPYHEQVYASDKRVSLPAKEKTYGSIEGLMNHFMLIMEGYGIRPPRGEAYHAVEGANGELGFYIVSDGTDKAHRVRVRPPCFTLMSGFSKMIEGVQVADIIPT